jgi:crossover junction endodeoxyribonuclease RuvC
VSGRDAVLRVVGVDTSLRSTGVAVVERDGSTLRAIEYGRLKMPRTWPVSQCLLTLDEKLTDFLKRNQPHEASIEGAFFSRNARTAMVLGQARGVAIAALARHGLKVYEYAPTRVKQAVVGYGQATKEQVGRMVTTMLGLPEPPQEDAADALAIALCLLNARTGYAAIEPKSI